MHHGHPWSLYSLSNPVPSHWLPHIYWCLCKIISTIVEKNFEKIVEKVEENCKKFSFLAWRNFFEVKFFVIFSNLEKFFRRKLLFTYFFPSLKIFSDTNFLAIFRNEITTLLTPSTSEGGKWGRWGWSRFSFWRFLITNPQC